MERQHEEYIVVNKGVSCGTTMQQMAELDRLIRNNKPVMFITSSKNKKQIKKFEEMCDKHGCKISTSDLKTIKEMKSVNIKPVIGSMKFCDEMDLIR